MFDPCFHVGDLVTWDKEFNYYHRLESHRDLYGHGPFVVTDVLPPNKGSSHLSCVVVVDGIPGSWGNVVFVPYANRFSIRPIQV